MSERNVLPAFASEAEEAQWWFDHREEHADNFLKAAAEGRVKRGAFAARLAAAQNRVVLNLGPDDMAKAKAVAERSGLEVDALIYQIVQDALNRAEQNAA